MRRDLEKGILMSTRRSFLGQLSGVSAGLAGRVFATHSLGEALAAITAKTAAASTDPAQWKSFGRILLERLGNAVRIVDGFAVHDATPSDCEFSFTARMPAEAAEVQIWAGLRCRDRDSRYVFALRGGNNNDLYLARYAPDGEAKFLGLAPLDFHPVPGLWYRLRAVATGDRFRLYVNDESRPRLDVRDKAALWQDGGAVIGGGWLPVEFKEVDLRPAVPGRAEDDQPTERPALSPAERERRRAAQRAGYRGAVLEPLRASRTELALDGKWLFAPEHEIVSSADPRLPECDDSHWHLMDVPDFWTPTLTWLHGETGFPELEGVASNKGLSDRYWEHELERLDGYTFDWRETRSAWYRHQIELPEEIAGRRLELVFDAIAKVSEVWVNGVKVGGHVGMFGAVSCDVTAAVHPGRNTVAVHVLGRLAAEASNQVMGVAVTVEVTASMLRSLPHGMYRDEAAGIWQPVKLVVTEPTWIEDVYVKPRLDGVDLEIALEGRITPMVSIAATIRSVADGAVLHRMQANAAADSEQGVRGLRMTTPRLAPRLWSPADPCLYVLEVELRSGDKLLDRRELRFGFRTFEARDGKLYLNGKPYWLRGANHFPHAIRPNDRELARRFMQLARQGNVAITRSHTAPFSEVWLEAADEAGMLVSCEGTWPWLMLEGEPPRPELIREWSDEFLAMLHKVRNHPSVVLWTVNNEMKFEDFDRQKPDLLRKKWEILSGTVKAIRALDATRPVVCDSSYYRKNVGSEYEDLIKPSGFDDGDIDDAHRYPTWYDPSFFHYYDGEFGKSLSSPGRPLISQELSTGYPRNDDGHACRFYLFKHATPQSLVGYEAYENRDPELFLRRQAFITRELGEAIRRSNRDNCSGVLHFAYLTWFRDVWNAQNIQPFRTYYALQQALQPVLASAELYGRNFYSGAQRVVRVCLANDAEDGRDLAAGELLWSIECGAKTLASGSVPTMPLPYYANQWCAVEMRMPRMVAGRRDAQLKLQLRIDGRNLSASAYDIVIADAAWTQPAGSLRAAVLSNKDALPAALALPGIRRVRSVAEIQAEEAVLVPDAAAVLAHPATADALRAHAEKGGTVLVFHPGDQLAKLFPAVVEGYREASGEIATMRVPESPVFARIEPLDLAWWELGAHRLPAVSGGVQRLAAGAQGAEALAEVVALHGYLHQPSDFRKVNGTPLCVLSAGAGRWVASEFWLLEAGDDPIAGRLLGNLLSVYCAAQ